MIHARLLPTLAAGLLAAVALAAPVEGLGQEPPAAGDEATRQAARSPRSTLARQRRDASTVAKGAQGWWTGTVAMVAILGAAGVLCIVAKRQAEAATGGRLRVVGRVSLPPKHAVFLVKAGGRTLLIGAGPQGAPSLLGELDDEDEAIVPDPATFAAGSASQRPAARPAGARPTHVAHRIDTRLGDES